MIAASAEAAALPDLRHRRPRIAVIAGETSGDLLAADLVAGLRRHYPDAEFGGIGGAAMRAAGVACWHDCSELSVMGLAEVLQHLPRLLALRRRLRRRLLAWPVDLLVGIDAPDFNLGLERWFKRRGIATAHYVSPSIWAWRERRAAHIAEAADRVLCLFPIEPPIYARYGVQADFVGHPMASQFPLLPDRQAPRQALAIDPEVPLLAVLPGSRLSEIRRLAAPFLAASALLLRQHPGFQVRIPSANAACAAALQDSWQQLQQQSQSLGLEAADVERLGHRLVWQDGHSQDLLRAADLVLLASGTAALEALLAKQPMVVGYRIAALTHWIVKRLGLLKVSHYSLPNILNGGALVDECMQEACTPTLLAARLQALWEDDARRSALLPRYLEIHRSLLPPKPDAAAQALASLLDR